MKKQKKSLLVLAVMVAFICTGIFLPGLIGAGDLEPNAAPGSTIHTLDEIHNKVANIGSALVEKTGQKTSDATGDDGYFKKGVAWPVPRFTDNGDGTVTDNLTGLIWLKNANCFKKRTWDNALIDCNGFSSGSCGLTDGSRAGDWRLPNVKELQSLMDYGEYNPALPSVHPFTGVQSSYYWSSTAYVGSTDLDWGVSLYNGFVSGLDNTYYYFYVWPVRGGN